MDQTQAYVKSTHLENGVFEIEFFHPAHNSMPGYLLTQLTQSIEDLENRPDCKIILLKSGGNRSFCAGASFDELTQLQNKEDGKNFFSGFARLLASMLQCPKLIILSVQGKAVGGGVGIIAAADYCLATKFASIRLSELNLGIGPFVIEPAISRKIGIHNFTKMTLQPDKFFSSQWALDKGLYNEIFDSNEELSLGSLNLCHSLAEKNPEALLALKSILNNDTGGFKKLMLERAEISGRLAISQFSKKQLKKIRGL